MRKFPRGRFFPGAVEREAGIEHTHTQFILYHEFLFTVFLFLQILYIDEINMINVYILGKDTKNMGKLTCRASQEFEDVEPKDALIFFPA